MPIRRVCEQGGREVTTDNVAHRLARCWVMTLSATTPIRRQWPPKKANEPDHIYFINIVAPRIKITSLINEINFNIIYKREGVAPGSLTLMLLGMSFSGHFGQPMPIAMHRPIG